MEAPLAITGHRCSVTFMFGSEYGGIIHSEGRHWFLPVQLLPGPSPFPSEVHSPQTEPGLSPADFFSTLERCSLSLVVRVLFKGSFH